VGGPGVLLGKRVIVALNVGIDFIVSVGWDGVAVSADARTVGVWLDTGVPAHAESKRQKQTNNNVFRAISSLHKKK
jgi:hypothetical protein